ncbi:hypothetical protein [Limnothrix sp. PR1529]|uniref:hypothetical protein n=1 Tax=Limnothrix sp. PR1529 TaxID=1704291 RepID=UPI000C151D1B|nr:hypothetical protein [Limnothrix sp. PR1529]
MQELFTSLNSTASLITSLKLEISENRSQIVTVSDTLNEIEAAIDLEISADSALKNEQQRKAKKSELLLAHQGFQQAKSIKRDLISNVEKLEANLSLQRRHWTSTKLQIEWLISDRRAEANESQAVTLALR